MTGPLAECSAVTCRFGQFVAVDRVDLRVGAAELVGLLGANGAGKTTLIRMLLGLQRPSGGEVRLFGESPSRQTRRRVGYLPQGLGLYEDLTAAENLEFTAAVFGCRPAVPVALQPVARIPVHALPLGTQRRIAFAAALAHSPDLLVLDEPTSGVDPLGRARLWETIADAADRGAGALVTTHNMEEAAECGRLVIMSAGRVVAAGTPSEIIGSARITVVESGSWAAAFNRLEEAGIPAAVTGRTLRVPGCEPAQVRRALGPVAARVYQAPAMLEERFLQLTLPASRTEATG